MSRAREFPLLSAEVTQQQANSSTQAEMTKARGKKKRKGKEERLPGSHVHGDRTRRRAQVTAVTNRWELSSAGAEVGLIEMNFILEEDERRRRQLIRHELFYLPFVSTSPGPKFKPVFVLAECWPRRQKCERCDGIRSSHLLLFWSGNIFLRLSAVSGDAPPQAHLLSAAFPETEAHMAPCGTSGCLRVLNVNASRPAAGLHAAASPRGRRGSVLLRLLLFVAVGTPAPVFRRRYLGEGYGPVQGQ